MSSRMGSIPQRHLLAILIACMVIVIVDATYASSQDSWGSGAHLARGVGTPSSSIGGQSSSPAEASDPGVANLAMTSWLFRT